MQLTLETHESTRRGNVCPPRGGMLVLRRGRSPLCSHAHLWFESMQLWARFLSMFVEFIVTGPHNLSGSHLNFLQIPGQSNNVFLTENWPLS